MKTPRSTGLNPFVQEEDISLTEKKKERRRSLMESASEPASPNTLTLKTETAVLTETIESSVFYAAFSGKPVSSTSRNCVLNRGATAHYQLG
jgi:hypothetical protein